MKVFMSHSLKDAKLVGKIADELKELGLDVWDDREIVPGENFAERISKALQESDAMIVLITPDTLNSKWMNWEVEYALSESSYENRLIPVFLGEPSDFPPEKIPWIFRRLNSINIREPANDNEEIKQIADALKTAA